MRNKIRGLNGDAFDFWLLGGGSAVFWIILASLHATGLASKPYFSEALVQVFIFVAFLEVFVNLPHFLISYRLAYGQGIRFVLKNPAQLIVVPLSLAAILILSAALAFDWPAVRSVETPLRMVLGFAGLSGSNAGVLLLGLLFVAQYSAVAWHYAKQAFGVTLFRLHAIGQALEPREVRWLKYSLLCVWLAYFTLAAGGDQVYTFGAISYRSLGLPDVLYYAALVLIPLSLSVNFWLLWKTAKRNGQRLDFPSCGSIFSVYCWFAPPFYLRVPAFFSTVSPFSHSLQYLSFAARYELNVQKKDSALSTALIVISIYVLTVLAGVIAYRQAPTLLDAAFPLRPAGFFAAQAYLFLNLHHYAIDNAIWRRTNPEIRGRLSVA